MLLSVGASRSEGIIRGLLERGVEDGAEASGRGARGWLALGAAVGLAMAATSLLAPPAGGDLPETAVARVNGELIPRDEWERALAALESDRREPLRPEDRRRVLDRLVEEELLVQYGLALGLARYDRRVRGDLVQAVIASRVASVDGVDFDPGEVEAFYAEEGDFFARPARLRVRTLRVRAEPVRSEAEADARAREALARLQAGEPFDAVEAALGDSQVAQVPDVPLPPTKLREYLGPRVVEVALGLGPGRAGGPVATASDRVVVQVVEHRPGRRPALAEVEPLVRQEMKRRAAEQALRDTLEQLRESGEVVLAEELR